MAINLIPNFQRAGYESAIDDIHETFGRSITVWRSSAEVITVDNPNYDIFTDGPPAQNIVYTPESKNFIARIKYIDRQEKEFGIILANTKIDVTQEFQLVRIKVDSETNDYIENCEKITVDGEDYIPITTSRAHGLFDPKWYTIYCKSKP